MCFIDDTSNYITIARRNTLRGSLTVFRNEIEHTVRLKIYIPLKSICSCSCCTFYSFQRSASITFKLWLSPFAWIRQITFYLWGLRSVINYEVLFLISNPSRKCSSRLPLAFRDETFSPACHRFSSCSVFFRRF